MFCPPEGGATLTGNMITYFLFVAFKTWISEQNGSSLIKLNFIQLTEFCPIFLTGSDTKKQNTSECFIQFILFTFINVQNKNIRIDVISVFNNDIKTMKCFTWQDFNFGGNSDIFPWESSFVLLFLTCSCNKNNLNKQKADDVSAWRRRYWLWHRVGEPRPDINKAQLKKK